MTRLEQCDGMSYGRDLIGPSIQCDLANSIQVRRCFRIRRSETGKKSWMLSVFGLVKILFRSLLLAKKKPVACLHSHEAAQTSILDAVILSAAFHNLWQLRARLGAWVQLPIEVEDLDLQHQLVVGLRHQDWRRVVYQ